MKSWRVFLLLVVLAMGVVSGLVYGWLVDPVVYVDTSPATLRIDFQTDIVLMVSDIYSHDHDLQGAINRLALLQRPDVIQLVAGCLDYAHQMSFSAHDISNIVQLNEAISTGVLRGSELP